MNERLTEATKAITDALKESASELGIRVHTDMGVPVDPPSVLVGPPTLEWQGFIRPNDDGCLEPTSARFLVIVIEDFNEYAAERLIARVPKVAAVLDGIRDAVVVRANPNNWGTAGSELPAYEIELDFSL